MISKSSSQHLIWACVWMIWIVVQGIIRMDGNFESTIAAVSSVDSLDGLKTSQSCILLRSSCFHSLLTVVACFI